MSAAFYHHMARKIITAPINIRVTPMTESTNRFMLRFTIEIRYTIASIPPIILIRNSIDCIPSIEDNPTVTGTFSEVNITGTTKYPDLAGVKSLANIPPYWIGNTFFKLTLYLEALTTCFNLIENNRFTIKYAIDA
jgi:hypothetical protein